MEQKLFGGVHNERGVPSDSPAPSKQNTSRYGRLGCFTSVHLAPQHLYLRLMLQGCADHRGGQTRLYRGEGGFLGEPVRMQYFLSVVLIGFVVAVDITLESDQFVVIQFKVTILALHLRSARPRTSQDFGRPLLRYAKNPKTIRISVRPATLFPLSKTTSISIDRRMAPTLLRVREVGVQASFASVASK